MGRTQLRSHVDTGQEFDCCRIHRIAYNLHKGVRNIVELWRLREVARDIRSCSWR